MKSRWKAVVACSLAMLAMGVLFSLRGYNNTWGLWNIKPMSPPFADLRVITGGAESSRQGFDPMVQNPGDPWHRRLNYPRVWQSLYSIGVTQNHTICIAVAFIGLFLVGVCLVLPNASYVTIVLVIAAILSPATLLGIERGNVDLFIFFLVSVSAVAVTRWPVFSAVAVMLGFILKLFPLFGWTVLLRVNRSMLYRLALTTFAFVAVYTVLTYSDLLLIWKATPRNTELSYGVNVFWMSLPDGNWYGRLLYCVIVFFSLLFACAALLRGDARSAEGQDEIVYLSAFRAGAAIYVGTFLLGNNYDYRLVFLILTIPQLVIWVKDPARGEAIGSIIILALILLVLWYLQIARMMGAVTHDIYDVSFVLDQGCQWLVFAGLLYLLFWSMPGWVKGSAQEMNSLTRRWTVRFSGLGDR